MNFDAFVASIIKTNLEAKRQMDKMGESFKSMMEMFNPNDMEAMFKTLNSFSEQQKKAEPKKTTEEQKNKTQEKCKDRYELIKDGKLILDTSYSEHSLIKNKNTTCKI